MNISKISTRKRSWLCIVSLAAFLCASSETHTSTLFEGMVNIGGNEAIVNAITPFLGHFARGAANKMASMLGAACAKSVIQGAINFYYSEKPPHYWNLLFFEIFNSLDYMGY